MQKRGQVTVFVIVGIVALVTIVLVFFAKDAILEQATKATDVEKYLNLQATSIQKEIKACTESTTQETIETLGAQGGYFEPLTFISYYNKKVGYRCTNREHTDSCQNDPIVLNSLKEKIEQRITTQLESCVDLSRFRNKDFTLQTGELLAELTWHDESTQIEVIYPITLSKNGITVTRDKTVTQMPVPLRSIVEATNKILNAEAAGSNVDPLAFSLVSQRKYVVEVNKPYPHRIYTISTPQGYTWQFAIEGEGRYESAY